MLAKQDLPSSNKGILKFSVQLNKIVSLGKPVQEYQNRAQGCHCPNDECITRLSSADHIQYTIDLKHRKHQC